MALIVRTQTVRTPISRRRNNPCTSVCHNIEDPDPRVNDSAVCTHFKLSDHSFEYKEVLILDNIRNTIVLSGEYKEAVYVRREKPTLNREGDLARPTTALLIRSLDV